MRKTKKGRAYDSSNLPEEKPVHTMTLQVPRELHLDVIRLVEKGCYVSASDFYRSAARYMVNTFNTASILEKKINESYD